MTGDSALTNLTNNDSTIAFAAPGAFKTLNVLGDYAGANGTIVLNTRLDQGGALAGQQTDRVLIGGNASGTTLLDVKATPDSPGGLTSPTGTLGAAEGISVAQVGGTSSMNVFQLKGGYALAPNSPYAYQRYAYGPGSTYGAADPAASLVGNAAQYWDYRLQSAYVTPDGPIDPPDVDPGGNGGGDGGGGGTGGGDHTPVPPDARPAVAPQVPAYLSAPVMLQFATLGDLDALHRRLGEIRDEGNDAPGEMFVRAWGGNFDYASNQSFRNFGYNATGDYGAVQIVGNLYRLRTENGVWRFGAAASVGWMHYEPNAVDGPSSSRSTTWRVAGFGTYQSTKGWYVDNILSVGGFNGSVSTAAHANAFSLEGQSYAASVEAGYPFARGWKGVNVEPQVQVIAQHLSFRNGTDADGLDVNIGSQNQVMGRLGVRMTRPFVAKGGAKVTPYVAIDYLHSFNGGTTVQVGDAGFQTGSLGDAMQYTVGVNSALNQKFSVFARASYQQQIGNAGLRGVLVNGGVRYRF